MPIAMVFTLMPAFFVVASLLGTVEGGSGAIVPVLAALTLLTGTVIGLFRFMRTLEEEPAADGAPSEDPDHDLPVAA